jgi:hypothetical protein
MATPEAKRVELFSTVYLKRALVCHDTAGVEVDLHHGQEGCLLEYGEGCERVIVEFVVGSGRGAAKFAQVELAVDDMQVGCVDEATGRCI